MSAPPIPLGAVVRHEAAPAGEERCEVENEDTAVFSARFTSGLARVVPLSLNGGTPVMALKLGA